MITENDREVLQGISLLSPQEEKMYNKIARTLDRLILNACAKARETAIGTDVKYMRTTGTFVYLTDDEATFFFRQMHDAYVSEGYAFDLEPYDHTYLKLSVSWLMPGRSRAEEGWRAAYEQITGWSWS